MRIRSGEDLAVWPAEVVDLAHPGRIAAGDRVLDLLDRRARRLVDGVRSRTCEPASQRQDPRARTSVGDRLL